MDTRFLVATKRRYKRVCLSVGPLLRCSVMRPFVNSNVFPYLIQEYKEYTILRCIHPSALTTFACTLMPSYNTKYKNTPDLMYSTALTGPQRRWPVP